MSLSKLTEKPSSEVIYLSENDLELMHYGVLGMKWGVRRNPSKQYGASSAKLNKMKRKVAKKGVKAAKLRAESDKLERKSTKMEMKATNEKKYQKARKKHFEATKLQAKASKVDRKIAKKNRKITKYQQKMGKAFSGVKMSDISEKDLKRGSEYLYMLTK